MLMKLKTQIVMILKTQIVMKLKKIQFEMKLKKTNCDETQKLKWWQTSKTQIVSILKNSNCDN